MSASTLPLALDQYSGRKLGKYEIICRLSTGGMSVIFLAFQRGLAGFRKFVVLKQILPDIVGEEEFVRMFLDEAKITAAFNHPNIAQVYDLDIQGTELFLAMEFIPGATLVEVAKACRANNEPIPTGFALMAVRDTALALHYAHNFTDPTGRQQTVIHRDVAEKNIMVTYEGTTKLLDFGIAKSLALASRTTVGMVKGTSGYMSPEQILGEKLDARSDVFSLGVVLHECLTGMRLFHGKNAEDGMMAALKESVAPPSRGNSEVTPELDAVVLKALARKRDERFNTARELARAIEKAAGSKLWHPEETAEFVARLFSARRDQTRKLMSNAETDSEVTGEHMLRQLLGEPARSGVRPQLREVPPPPPRKTSGGGVQVSPVTAPLPSRLKGAALEPEVQVITNTPTPAARLVTKAGNAPTPWGDEATHDGHGGPTHPPSAPTPPKPAPPDDHEEDPDGLTVPIGSVPPELLEELELLDRRSVVTPEGPTTSSSVSTTSVYEDTTPGVAMPRRRGRLVPTIVFLGIMLSVFGVGLVMTGLHRRILGLSTDEEEPVGSMQPLTEVHPAAAAAPAKEEPTAPPPAAKEAQEAPKPVAEPISPAAVRTPEPKETPDAKEPARKAPVETKVTPPADPASTKAEQARPVAKASAPKRAARNPEVGEPEDPSPSTSEPEELSPPPLKSVGLLPTAVGSLTLSVTPPVKVLYKSQDLGTTPLKKIPLPVGKHTLRLLSPDGKVHVLQVEIKDRPANLQVKLEELPQEP